MGYLLKNHGGQNKSHTTAGAVVWRKGRLAKQPEKSTRYGAGDTRKQRFRRNCEASQNRRKAAAARQRAAALLGGTQSPITQQMPLSGQKFAALFSCGTAPILAGGIIAQGWE